MYGAQQGVYREPARLNDEFITIAGLLIIVAPLVLAVVVLFWARAVRTRNRKAFLENLKLNYRFDLEGSDDWGHNYWVDTTKRTAVLFREGGEPNLIAADDLLGITTSITTGAYKAPGTCLEFLFCDPARPVDKLHFEGNGGKADLVYTKLRAAGFNKQDTTTASLIPSRLRAKAASTRCPDCNWRRDECKLGI